MNIMSTKKNRVINNKTDLSSHKSTCWNFIMHRLETIARMWYLIFTGDPSLDFEFEHSSSCKDVTDGSLPWFLSIGIRMIGLPIHRFCCSVFNACIWKVILSSHRRDLCKIRNMMNSANSADSPSLFRRVIHYVCSLFY